MPRADRSRATVRSLQTALMVVSCLGCEAGKSRGDSDGRGTPDYVAFRNDLIEDIPKAASMIPSEFVSMAAGTGDADFASNKSLTYALLRLDFGNPDPEIRFEPEGLLPDALKNHVLRKGIATLIHSENIDRVDLRVLEQGKALGTVFFDVPRMVKGRVHFQALKGKKGRWQVEEFILLGERQRVHQTSEGRWTIGPLSAEELEHRKKVSARPPLSP